MFYIFAENMLHSAKWKQASFALVCVIFAENSCMNLKIKIISFIYIPLIAEKVKDYYFYFSLLPSTSPIFRVELSAKTSLTMLVSCSFSSLIN